jgi:peptide-methionine (R)-S-oxide reductase
MSNLSEEEIRQKLTPEQYEILRNGATEPPFTGKYLKEKGEGIYICVVCGEELFSSDTKFESGTGWPSFTEPKNKKHIDLVLDKSHGMERVEVKCKKCGSHLGHVFQDGPSNSGGNRFCINSVCLNFKKIKGGVEYN